MKSTGIVRKIDELGRIVLPIEMRRTLGIEEKDPLEIFVEDSRIILKKYIPKDEAAQENKYICSVCRRELEKSDIENHSHASPYLRVRARVKQNTK